MVPAQPTPITLGESAIGPADNENEAPLRRELKMNGTMQTKSRCAAVTPT